MLDNILARFSYGRCAVPRLLKIPMKEKSRVQDPTKRTRPVAASRLLGCLAVGALALAQVACEKAEVASDPPEQDAVAPTRPNVVLIIIDTLRADKLGCYGFSEPTTPELDAYAAAGVQFDRVVTPCSWTRPAIGSMLTGKYPQTLGLYREIGEMLPETACTLAEAFKADGYTTIGATANPNTNTVFGFNQGFDHYLDSHAIWSWMAPMVNEENHSLNKESGLAPATELYDWVLQQIGEGDPGPYYVQAVIMEMHEYGRGDRPLTRPEFREKFLHAKNTAYLDALRQSSHDIKVFVDRLLALPGWENTLFVFTSDHGEGLRDHPDVPFSQTHGAVLYESNVLVPLIFYATGAPLEPRRIARSVRLLDLTPTILDYAGIAIPDGVQGTSLVPLMRRTGTRVDLPEFFVSQTNLIDRFVKRGVHGNQWNYFENRDGHQGLNPRELQRAGVRENGAATDQIHGADQRTAQAAARMQGYLAEWEQRFPNTKPTLQVGGLSKAEIDQLRDIGYMD